ncbi:hypothetical protein GCM10009777_07470 [Microbacterium pumilum]|uniref:Lipoprotein LpqB beta-propeller domain-containing protein n=2 Tax=Microbacterium pumilum TaxID=344165 RepID=A0ABP5DAN3_9MICO
MLVVAVLPGCAGTPAEPSTAPPTATATAGVELEGSLLFTRAGGQYGDETVFLVPGDGSPEKQLTDLGEACCARVSPDGSSVLLLPSAQPVGPLTSATIPVEGGEPAFLSAVDPDLNLVAQLWSPDGTRIASEGWANADASRTGVYTAASPSGDDLVRVTTTDTGGHDVPLDYSPDGTELLFFRGMPEPDWDLGGSLWIVATDGTDLRPVETGNIAPSWWARWSPDGEKILFAAERNQPVGGIWTVGADGSGLTQIYIPPDGTFPITPEWSPDGSQIVFALDPDSNQFAHPDNSVIVINSDGTEPTTLMPTSAFKRNFDWFEPSP